nr:MAG TPA: hypothetical protein [Caudoviricetes sp.]
MSAWLLLAMLLIVDFNPLKGDYNRLMSLSYYLG